MLRGDKSNLGPYCFQLATVKPYLLFLKKGQHLKLSSAAN